VPSPPIAVAVVGGGGGGKEYARTYKKLRKNKYIYTQPGETSIYYKHAYELARARAPSSGSAPAARGNLKRRPVFVFVSSFLFFFFYIYFRFSRRFHDVPVGIFAQIVAKLGLLSEIHQVVESGKGRIQIGRLQGGVEALGRTQKQAGHELRDDGTRSQVILI